MKDLAGMAKAAVAAKLVDVGPQAAFLRELAQRVAQACPGPWHVKELRTEPRVSLLRTGELDSGTALEELLSGSPAALTLEVLAYDLEAIALVDALGSPLTEEIRAAVQSIRGGSTSLRSVDIHTVN